MAAISVAMIAASLFGAWPISNTEVLGFVTGGVCVWLAVRTGRMREFAGDLLQVFDDHRQASTSVEAWMQTCW